MNRPSTASVQAAHWAATTSIALVRFLCAKAKLRLIFFLWRPLLPDPKDDFVLELAVESTADFLITFNGRDFAGAERFGVQAEPGNSWR